MPLRLQHLVLRSAAVVLALAASAHAQRARLPDDDQLRANGLELGWHTQISMNAGRDTLRDIAFDGTQLYAQASSGVIQAIAADGPAAAEAAPPRPGVRFAARGIRPAGGGQTLWINQVGVPELPSARPAANSKDLFVVVGSELFVLEKSSGRRLWRARLPSSPSAPLAASDDYAYVGFIDGQFRAFDVRRREQAWFYRTGRTITVPALPIGDVVAFASRNGLLYVSSASTRDIAFQYETDFPVTAALASRGEWLFMASEDFKVYCLHSRTGLTRWVTPLGNPISQELVVVGDELYVCPDGGGMYRLDTETGRRRWWAPSTAAFVAASPNRIYGYGPRGRLMILDRATGQRVGMVNTRQYTNFVINRYDDRLYLATRHGLLICLHQPKLHEPVRHVTPADASAEAQPEADAPGDPDADRP